MLGALSLTQIEKFNNWILILQISFFFQKLISKEAKEPLNEGILINRKTLESEEFLSWACFQLTQSYYIILTFVRAKRSSFFLIKSFCPSALPVANTSQSSRNLQEPPKPFD